MPPERSIKDRTTIAWDAVDAVMVGFFFFFFSEKLICVDKFTESDSKSSFEFNSSRYEMIKIV